MVEYSEQSIKFGWLNKEEIAQAIESQSLNEYNIVFTKDTHEQYIISASLEPVPIKSRIRIFSSVDTAIEEINKSSVTYSGEILSIRDGEKFIAYVVNQLDDGAYNVDPIHSDNMVDYNGLQNVPLKNIDGTVTEPIVLTDLEDGFYKVTGHFTTPVGTTTSSIVGNIIVVETEIDRKKIKRICSDIIVDYTIDNNGEITSDKYITQQYIESKGYATNASVDVRLEAFKLTMQEYVEDYVETTVSMLIRYIVSEEISSRYSTNQDIQDLFN